MATPAATMASPVHSPVPTKLGATTKLPSAKFILNNPRRTSASSNSVRFADVTEFIDEALSIKQVSCHSGVLKRTNSAAGSSNSITPSKDHDHCTPRSAALPPARQHAKMATPSSAMHQTSSSPSCHASNAFLGRQKELQKLREAQRELMTNNGGAIGRTSETDLALTPASTSASASTSNLAQKSSALQSPSNAVAKSSAKSLQASGAAQGTESAPQCDAVDAMATVTASKASIYPAVLVWGISGTGKSMLVDHFLETSCCQGRCHATDTGARHSTSNNNNNNKTTNRQDQGQVCTCCYILRGKNDEYTGTSDLFSAITQAMRDFAAQLKRGSSEELERLRRLVQAAFPADGFETIVNVLPCLGILSTESDSSESTDGEVESISLATEPSGKTSRRGIAAEQHQEATTSLSASLSHSVSTDNVWNQLQYMFLKFIKVISTPERPVYMFLDDLQWSSNISLDLLANLVDDVELQNFMLLGAIRQETNPHNGDILDLPPDAPLMASFLSRFTASDKDGSHVVEGAESSDPSLDSSTHKEHEGHKRSLQQITINNLSPTELDVWLSSLLGRTDTQLLSKKLYAKTKGNIFFTFQALEELQRKNFLVYSRISFQWEWNLGQQGDGTPANDSRSLQDHDLPISDDIITAIDGKLQDLPKPLQQVLSIASYIRSNFDIAILQKVLISEQQHADGAIDSTDTDSGTSGDGTPSFADKEHLANILERAVLERLLLNPIGGTTYRFAHDRIQQAAHEMVPFGETRDKLRVRIGHCLLRMYREAKHNATKRDLAKAKNKKVKKQVQAKRRKNSDPKKSRDGTSWSSKPSRSSTPSTKSSRTKSYSMPEEDDGLLFIAADHLNSVQAKDHKFSVTLNLQVGEKALQMAALASAAVYLQKASNALRRVRNNSTTGVGRAGSEEGNGTGSSSVWEGNHRYDICVRIYRARCDVELSLGHFEIGYKLGNELLEKAKTLEDKLPTYYAIMRALGREDRHTEALELGMKASSLLGSMPKRWYGLHIAKGMMKIKSFMKRCSNDEIAKRPIMTDAKKIFAMKIATETGTRAYMTKNMVVWLLNACKMLQRTIKHGLSEDSAVAFAVYGLIASSTGDQPMANRCAWLAHKIAERTNAKANVGSVCLLTSNWITPFSLPFTEQLQQCRRGYTYSMEVGEFEMGLLNWQGCIGLAFIAGFELDPLIKASESTLQQLRTYKVSATSGQANEMLGMFKMLTGADEIDWAAIEVDARRDVSRENHDPSKTAHIMMYFYTRLVVTVYFRRYAIAESLLKNFCLAGSHELSYFKLITEGFYSGLIAAARYRETGRKEHLTKLRKMTQYLNSLGKTRGRNFLHQVFVLEAEHTSIRKRDKTSPVVKNAYDIAITLSIKSSCLHEAGLACELAGEHYIRSSRPELVGDYFVRAVELYQEWGCTSKVDDIKDRRGEYLRNLGNAKRRQLVNALNSVSGHSRSNADGQRRCIIAGSVTDASSRRSKLDVLSTYTPARKRTGTGADAGLDADADAEHLDSAASKLNYDSSDRLEGVSEEGGDGSDQDDVSVLTDNSDN